MREMSGGLRAEGLWVPTSAGADRERRRLTGTGERVPPLVSIVIPTLNEERSLPDVLQGVVELAGEIVVVDGHSTDRSLEVARSLVPDAVVVEQPGTGKGDALRAGFAASTGDAVVMLDADGSMRPEEVSLFVDELRAGAEVVKGSRFLPTAGSDDIDFIRRLGNHGLVVLFNRLYGAHFTDLCYGYMAFWHRCLPALEFDVDGFEVEAALNVRSVLAGLRVAEVPSYELSRRFGQSNLHAVRDGWRIARLVLGECGGLRMCLRRRSRAGSSSPVPVYAFEEAPAEAEPVRAA